MVLLGGLVRPWPDILGSPKETLARLQLSLSLARHPGIVRRGTLASLQLTGRTYWDCPKRHCGKTAVEFVPGRTYLDHPKRHSCNTVAEFVPGRTYWDRPKRHCGETAAEFVPGRTYLDHPKRHSGKTVT